MNVIGTEFGSWWRIHWKIRDGKLVEVYIYGRKRFYCIDFWVLRNFIHIEYLCKCKVPGTVPCPDCGAGM